MWYGLLKNLKMERTRGEKISFFVAVCKESADDGAAFILSDVFQSHAPDTNVNAEVARKYNALTEFAENVYIALDGQRSHIGSLGPRQYAEMIRDMHNGTNAENNRIYAAFMIAGHHIRELTVRELTERPDYVVPVIITQPPLQSGLRA